MYVCMYGTKHTAALDTGDSLFYSYSTFSSLTVVLIKIINHCVEAGWLWRDGPVCDYVLALCYLARLRGTHPHHPLPPLRPPSRVFCGFIYFFSRRERTSHPQPPPPPPRTGSSCLSTSDINCAGLPLPQKYEPTTYTAVEVGRN